MSEETLASILSGVERLRADRFYGREPLARPAGGRVLRILLIAAVLLLYPPLKAKPRVPKKRGESTIKKNLAARMDRTPEEHTRKRQRVPEVRALDGAFPMTESNAHILAQIAPLFRSARECDAVVALDVPASFLIRAITLGRAFMEWDEQEGQVKLRQRARVCKMLAAIRACPFYEQFADTIGMGYTLPKMEERLRDDREELEQREEREVTPQEMQRYFGIFPAAPLPFSLEVCSIIVSLKRKTPGMVISFEHSEIAGTAYIGDVCVVRGRNAPEGCAIQSATIALGLNARVTLCLSFFEKDLTADDETQNRWQLVDTPPTRLIEAIRAHHDALMSPGKCYDELRLSGVLLELATMISALA